MVKTPFKVLWEMGRTKKPSPVKQEIAAPVID